MIDLVGDFKKQCPFYKDDYIFKIVIDHLREQQALVDKAIERERIEAKIEAYNNILGYIKAREHIPISVKAVKGYLMTGISDLKEQL